MPVIIDGHNLIGKMSEIRLGERDDEEKLLRILARQLHRGSQKFVVVFDKGADLDSGLRQKGPRLSVIFAPPKGSADEIIIDMIKQDPNPKGLTIVSSDNEIRRCARSRRARLVSSEDFAKKLESAPKRPRSAPGSAAADTLDVEEWLDYFKKGRA
jgi:predicted RNA-binding protein with PIN domain